MAVAMENYKFSMPIPRMVRCVLFHQHPKPDKGGYTHQFATALRIVEWDENAPMPERHNAYGYQVAQALYTPAGWLDVGAWEVDAETIGPMIYWGEKVKAMDGVIVCLDQFGVEHDLQPDDVVLPLQKGQITVSHYGHESGAGA